MSERDIESKRERVARMSDRKREREREREIDYPNHLVSPHNSVMDSFVLPQTQRAFALGTDV